MADTISVGELGEDDRGVPRNVSGGRVARAVRVVGWTTWVTAAAVFGAVLYLQAYYGWCYKYPEESPMSFGYFSWWPFGAGCDFYTGPDQQPGPLWTIALVAIVVSGVGLWVATRKSSRERQTAETSP